MHSKKYGNPPLQTQVHELVTNDGVDVQDHEYEVDYHDIDTPVSDLLSFQADSSRGGGPPNRSARKLHLGHEPTNQNTHPDETMT